MDIVTVFWGQCVALCCSVCCSVCCSELTTQYLYIHICVGYGYRDSLLRPVCCIVLQCVLQRMLQWVDYTIAISIYLIWILWQSAEAVRRESCPAYLCCSVLHCVAVCVAAYVAVRWLHNIHIQHMDIYWYSRLQIGWHRISRLFLKLFNEPEFCPCDLRLVPNSKL